MKGLHIKKLAAIAAGAALVGSALAPVVTAIDFTKDQLYNTEGVPTVSIIVGEKAAASDAIWAGNIAAAIAKNAVKTATPTGTAVPSSCAAVGAVTGTWGAPTDLKAVLTLGGTVKLSTNVRSLQDTVLNSTSNTPEYRDNVGNTYFTNFKNGSVDVKINSVSTTSTETESVWATVDAEFNTSNTGIKDLIAKINAGDLNYNAKFSPGIAQFTDTGSDDHVSISFLGKPYIVDSVTSDTMVLVKSGAERTYSKGDLIDVTGRDGGKYKMKLVGGGLSGTTNQAIIELQDSNGNVLDKKTFNNSSDVIFYNASGKEINDTKVSIRDITKANENNSDVFTFTLLVGSDKLEIKNNNRFPYDPNDTTSSKKWEAVLNYSLDSNTNTLDQVTIRNGSLKTWDTEKPLTSVNEATPSFKQGSKVISSGVTAAGLLEDTSIGTIGNVVFRGFDTAGIQFTTVKVLGGANAAASYASGVTTYGAIDYFDTSGTEHQLPLAINLTGGNGSFKFGGWDYVYAWGTPSGTSTADGNFYLDQGTTAIGSIADPATVDVNLPFVGDRGSANSWTDIGDISDTNKLIILTGKNSKKYAYVFKKVQNQSGGWLSLAGRSSPLAGPAKVDASSASQTANANWGDTNISAFSGKIDDLQNSSGTLFFLGTDTQDSDSVSGTIGDYNTGGGAIAGVPYYIADTTEFVGGSAPQGSSSGVYKTAVFKLYPTTTRSTMPDAGAANNTYTIYVDTEDHKVVDTANINKTNYNGKLIAFDFNATNSLTGMSEYTGSSSYYTKAYDDNGVRSELSSRQLTFVVPNRAMKAYVTVEPTGATSEIVGEDSIATAKGATWTSTAGTKVTIKDITYTAGTVTGGTTADANAPASTPVVVTVAPVKTPASWALRQMVYTDASEPAGKLIIVGGPAVNKLAKNYAAMKALKTSGQTAYAVDTATGNILVAGYTAADTRSAAGQLIADIEKIA